MRTRTDNNSADVHISEVGIPSQLPLQYDVSKVYKRIEAVQYLLAIVDHANEEREVVQVAMNYFDRYIRHVLQTEGRNMKRPTASSPTTAAAAACDAVDSRPRRRKSSVRSSNSFPSRERPRNDDGIDRHSISQERESIATAATGVVNQDTHMENQPDKAAPSEPPTSSSSTASTSSPMYSHLFSNDRLSVVLLTCLDLAIKMYSPFSGHWANVQRYQRYSSRRMRRRQEENKRLRKQSRAIPARGDEIPMDGSFPTVSSQVSTTTATTISTVSEEFTSSNSSTENGLQNLQTPYWIGSSFNSLIYYLHNRVSCQQVGSVQEEVLQALQFYLHPPTCAQVVRSIIGLFDLHIPHQRLAHDISMSSMPMGHPPPTHKDTYYWKILEAIGATTMIQVELSMFHSRLGNMKPSVVAIAALENAFHQILNGLVVKEQEELHAEYCNSVQESFSIHGVNTVTPPPSHRRTNASHTAGSSVSSSTRNPTLEQQLAAEMTRSLCHISQEIMGLSSYGDTAEIYLAREQLFDFLKHNSPEMIHIDHFCLKPSMSTTLSLSDTDSFCLSQSTLDREGSGSYRNTATSRFDDDYEEDDTGSMVRKNLFPEDANNTSTTTNATDSSKTFQPIPDGPSSLDEDMHVDSSINNGISTDELMDVVVMTANHGHTGRKRRCRRNSTNAVPTGTAKRSSPAHVSATI